MGVDLINYYSRDDVQRAILKCAKDREIAVRYAETGQFGKRPEILQYKSDIVEFAKQGASSFHCSVERWKNPSQLTPSLKKDELDNLRIGWDLLLDIDCPFLEYSKITADLLVRALKAKGVKSISVKFSGNHGFHIAVPFEAFPKEVSGIETRDIKNYFPDGVRKIALYLQEMIRPHLSNEILKINNVREITKKTNKNFGDLVSNGIFDPFKIISIDSLMISSRHLFRMPFSVNEKSGLASVTLAPESIIEFNKEEAKLENVQVKLLFLEGNAAKNEAKNLFDDVFHWNKEEGLKDEFNKLFKKETTTKEKRNEFENLSFAIAEEHFPPCIKAITKGLEDGRKRGLFVLTNFLACCGWSHDKIEDFIKNWNKKNREPLRENYIISHLKYHKQRKQRIPPPNCRQYYKDFQVCFPDLLCDKIRNPVVYAKRKVRFKTIKAN